MALLNYTTEVMAVVGLLSDARHHALVALGVLERLQGVNDGVKRPPGASRRGLREETRKASRLVDGIDRLTAELANGETRLQVRVSEAAPLQKNQPKTDSPLNSIKTP